MSEQEKELTNISSGESVRSEAELAAITSRIAAALEEDVKVDLEENLTPAFKELREPRLPDLPRENRARLLMQTPNRLYFYWSLKNNPYQILHRVFGDNVGSYTLVLKLVNETRGTDEIHATDAAGNYWFSVEADCTYHAEIGFYAPNRPYFRALFSNPVTTPRRSPSPRIATDADWTMTTEEFAKVLDVSGFKQDAVEVVLAGDDREASDEATRSAFTELTGESVSFAEFTADELRFALLALASGVTLESLRWSISPALFEMLSKYAESLSAEAALAALQAKFNIEGEEFDFYEEASPAVYGASLVAFPRRVTSVRKYPNLSTDSSSPVRRPTS